MSGATQPDWPLNLQLPPELAFLGNPISNYFEAKAPYNNARLGALVFTPPPQPQRLFLVQLSESSDPNAFSTAWNVPHGFPQASDPTLLHTLARIVNEQTGMQLQSVRAMAGSEIIGPEHSLGVGNQWMKLLFVIEVEELQPFSELEASIEPAVGNATENRAVRVGPPDYRSILISLDARIHRQYAWVTQGDFQEFLSTGLFPHWETNQYEMMLQAFDMSQQSPVDNATSSSHSPSEPSSEPPPKPSSPAAPNRSTSKHGHKRVATTTGVTKPKQSQTRTPKRKPSNSSFFHRFSIREGKQ